ncbi:MAG TPA: WD40 repeat domain-containing protein [Gemmata sp.]
MLVLELGHKERIESLAFSPDGGSLVTPSATGVHIWRGFASGARPARLPGHGAPRLAQFTHDGRWLFVTSSTVTRIDPTGSGFVDWDVPVRFYTFFDVSPVAGLIVINQNLVAGPNTSRLSCWRIDDPSPAGKVWERNLPFAFYNRPRFLPDGTRFVRLEGGWVRERHRAEYATVIYSTATGEPVHTSAPHASHSSDVSVSPDGRWFVGLDTNRVHLWPLGPGEVGQIKNDGRRHFTSAAFHPSGRYLAVTSNDATVKLFDTTNWELARTFTWNIGRMRSVAFSPDGALAAAGSDKGQVIVWDVDG